MSAKHTPGPWSLQTRQTQVYVSACDFQIALLCDGDGSQIEANAGLIAAAPDMLEALKAISEVGIYEIHDWQAIAERMQATAIAAITKAEGRS